jgi:lipopolysaccharide/colanic/teichoic acid biosynthesis glycosyltransferase
LIKLGDRGPVFIVQNRIGKNNKIIKIKKFRTMSFNDNEQDENKTANKTKTILFI